MTPEIQQAVHAVRTLRRELAEKGTATVDGAFIAAQFQVLASAYIDDLERRDREAAEQAVAVDEEWLRSVGFMEGRKELYLFYEGTRLEYRNSQVHRSWVLNNQAYPLDKWRTRGDVLRLLTALGINVERGGE